MVCTIFKSAGIHVIGLTLFYFTIACIYIRSHRATASFQTTSIMQIPVKQVQYRKVIKRLKRGTVQTIWCCQKVCGVVKVLTRYGTVR